jgi:hypothetical protein
MFDKAIEYEPTNPSAVYNKGKLYRKNGKKNEAF